MYIEIIILPVNMVHLATVFFVRREQAAAGRRRSLCGDGLICVWLCAFHGGDLWCRKYYLKMHGSRSFS